MTDRIRTHASPFDRVSLSADFPEIEDVEGYVEQEKLGRSGNTIRTHFHRVGDTVSETVVSCVEPLCEGAYYIRDIIMSAYSRRASHAEGNLPCPACAGENTKAEPCRARYSVDIRFKPRAGRADAPSSIEGPEIRGNM